jgi:hypothetical protein
MRSLFILLLVKVALGATPEEMDQYRAYVAEQSPCMEGTIQLLGEGIAIAREIQTVSPKKARSITSFASIPLGHVRGHENDLLDAEEKITSIDMSETFPELGVTVRSNEALFDIVGIIMGVLDSVSRITAQDREATSFSTRIQSLKTNLDGLKDGMVKSFGDLSHLTAQIALRIAPESFFETIYGVLESLRKSVAETKFFVEEVKASLRVGRNANESVKALDRQLASFLNFLRDAQIYQLSMDELKAKTMDDSFALFAELKITNAEVARSVGLIVIQVGIISA